MQHISEFGDGYGIIGVFAHKLNGPDPHFHIQLAQGFIEQKESKPCHNGIVVKLIKRGVVHGNVHQGVTPLVQHSSLAQLYVNAFIIDLYIEVLCWSAKFGKRPHVVSIGGSLEPAARYAAQLSASGSHGEGVSRAVETRGEFPLQLLGDCNDFRVHQPHDIRLLLSGKNSVEQFGTFVAPP